MQLQALRVVGVVLLRLASPRLGALGRSSPVLSAALSVVSLSSAVRAGAARALQALIVVIVDFLADEGRLAPGESVVVLAATLSVEGLSRLRVGRDSAIRLGLARRGCGGEADRCRGQKESGDGGELHSGGYVPRSTRAGVWMVMCVGLLFQVEDRERFIVYIRASYHGGRGFGTLRLLNASGKIRIPTVA